MNLYLLRHAIAVEPAEWKKADSDRPLTKEGVRKMKGVARAIRHMDLEISGILTSPYRRAYDTAMLVAKELKLVDKLRVFRHLAVDGDPKQVIRRLGSDFRTWESVMLIGHEPYLNRLISTLIRGDDQAAIDLKKAGLAKLTFTSRLVNGRCATLEWLLTPKILRKLI